MINPYWMTKRMQLPPDHSVERFFLIVAAHSASQTIVQTQTDRLFDESAAICFDWIPKNDRCSA